MDVVHSPGIDEPIAQDVGGAVTYYHADALGSVQTHTNSSGGITTTIQFDAWGNALVGALGPYGFTGREPDSETGLQFYRSRYYDSGLGRFVSEDRSGYVDGPNLYRYVKGRPTQFKDPSGRQTAAEKKYCSDPANQESCTKGLVCAAMATVIFAGFDDGTPGNAMKHCVWSCCLVRMAGPEAAYQITTAHEDGQRDRCASSQDKANNAKGMAFGLANPNKTCFEVCDPRNLQCEKKAPPCSP